MTTTITAQPQMAAWDAGTFEILQRQAGLERLLSSLITSVHRAAGDKQRRGVWGYTHDEAVQVLTEVSDPSANTLLAEISQARAAIEQLGEQIDEREAVWVANGRWNRYFPCLNRDGHIHSSLRGCPTVRWDTDMGWATEMSGLTPGQAIHQGIPGQFPGLGETLCTVCFPDAPAEWCRTKSEVTRAEREAAREAKAAAKAAEKAVKNLTADEAAMLSEAARERVTTVAAAKALVREAAETAVELEWARTDAWRSRWSDPQRADEVTAYMERKLESELFAAELAVKILAAREAAVPGTGWTRADADKAVANTEKRARRDYGLN